MNNYVFGEYQLKNIAAMDHNQDLVDRANAGVHPFFGIQITDNQGVVSGTQASLNTLYQDIVPRELGISKEIYNNNKLLKGLANPGNYLLRKNEDLQRIAGNLANIYKTEHIKQMNRGKSIEEAKRIALKYTKAIEELQLKEHEEEFPTELTGVSVDRLKGKNRIGNF